MFNQASTIVGQVAQKNGVGVINGEDISSPYLVLKERTS